ncbi:hypothetical protein J2T57_001272 [Natronocella acetinitrilica]|uniref:DUF3631 domain-containing protein n=1 Tax=Natronocella acetinitrilica TaxID=414046 RepID=A0AAE3G1N2_9GAMM|nr:hypothetical protein [Natronocella acetinitrilica]MCP1674170.1 hypothetical protein [Natronocella acetinitrilica]
MSLRGLLRRLTEFVKRRKTERRAPLLNHEPIALRYRELALAFLDARPPTQWMDDPSITPRLEALRAWQHACGVDDETVIGEDFSAGYADRRAAFSERLHAAGHNHAAIAAALEHIDGWRRLAVALALRASITLYNDSEADHSDRNRPPAHAEPDAEGPDGGAQTQSEDVRYFAAPSAPECDGRRPLKVEEGDCADGDADAGSALLPPYEGRAAYRPIDVNCAYHNGALYYPVQTLVGRHIADKSGESFFAEQVETVVIRSDRQVLTARTSEAPDDVNSAQHVLRLSDGTLIDRMPKANSHGTWEWDAINDYLAGRPPSMDLGEIAGEIVEHLRSRVWLPHDSDYWLLTATALLTYGQSVFDAVPLIQLQGPAGTGKSELSTALSEVSANAVMIGQTTPATIIRIIDESGGLVVIDDLESIAQRGGGKTRGNFSEMVQVLKVSYKRSTACKVVTDSRTMRPVTMNFFGVKIISNTGTGTDPILGTRMLSINTRRAPLTALADFHGREKLPPEALRRVRNDAHSWVFANVPRMREAYLELVADKTNREDEIAAPLRVLARLSGRQDFIDGVDTALERQRATPIEKLEPATVLSQALENLIAAGYRQSSTSHLALEMRRLIDEDNVGLPLGEAMPHWLRSEAIGRHLRQYGLAEEGAAERVRLHGAHLRLFTINRDYRRTVLQAIGADPDARAERNPVDFCTSCERCPYAALDCEIQERRGAAGQQPRARLAASA